MDRAGGREERRGEVRGCQGKTTPPHVRFDEINDQLFP